MFKNGKIKQALEGWSFILENQSDHLHAFFNYSLGITFFNLENPSKEIFMKLNQAKSLRLREYFKFLCKIRSRRFLTLKKHQIPNHLHYQEHSRTKIIETMKFLDNNKKKIKKSENAKKLIKLQGFLLFEKVLCSYLFKEELKLILIHINQGANDIINFSCYNIINGQRVSNVQMIISNMSKNLNFYQICANKEKLIFWTHDFLVFIKITDSINIIKSENISDISYIKFNKVNPNTFYLVQRNISIRLMDFDSLKILETILAFTIENSKFSTIEIFENNISSVILLAQENTIKILGNILSSSFPKELNIQGKGPIKSLKLISNSDPNDSILILTSDTIEILPFSNTLSARILVQSAEIEKYTNIVVLSSKNLILAYENNYSNICFKLFSLKDLYISQNFTLNFPFNGLPFLEELISQNDDILSFLYLDNQGYLNNIELDISEEQSKLIKNIWEPEEVYFNDIDIELQKNYYDGLIELIESWKESQNSKDFQNLYEIAENGKFYWNFKTKNEIKTLFLELNRLNKNISKINDSSEESLFDDINKISTYAFSKSNSLLAISELGTNFIKILEIKENLKLKFILEFNYGQSMDTPHTDILLFSESDIKKSSLYLFHNYNDMEKLMCLGMVIWNLSENKLIKRLSFNEETLMCSIGFCEKLQHLYCFFNSGKCLAYQFSVDEINEELYLSQTNPHWIINFYVNDFYGFAVSNDNLIRVYDLKQKNLVKLLYLSGEPIVFCTYDNLLQNCHVMDSNQNIFQVLFKNFNPKKSYINQNKIDQKFFGHLYFFDSHEQTKDMIGVLEEGELIIFNVMEKTKKFKYSMKSEFGIKAAFWLSYPSKIIIIGSTFIKILYLYIKWK